LRNRRALTELAMDEAHTVLGQLGEQKTSQYVRRWHWWPKMGHDIHFGSVRALFRTRRVRVCWEADGTMRFRDH
ncbi:hypothetical protein B0H13DRAFT_1672074, partial [Mycena leptocephala]